MLRPNNPSSPARVSWGEQRNQLNSMFPVLTDANLNYEKGKKNEMPSKIQITVGKTQDELTTIIVTI